MSTVETRTDTDEVDRKMTLEEWLGDCEPGDIKFEVLKNRAEWEAAYGSSDPTKREEAKQLNQHHRDRVVSSTPYRDASLELGRCMQPVKTSIYTQLIVSPGSEPRGHLETALVLFGHLQEVTQRRVNQLESQALHASKGQEPNKK